MLPKVIKCAIAAMLLCWTSAAAQTDAPPSPRSYLETGDYNGARIALRRLIAGDPKAPLHAAYLEALIKLRQNDPVAAIKIFREILSVDPGYEPARRDLTISLALTGRTESALYHAERLVSSTADERLRSDLQAYISQNVQGKPYGFALRFALLPSSNANRGTRETEFLIGDLPFVLDEKSRADSATAISLGATVWNRWSFDNNWTATLSGSLDARLYDGVLPNEYRAGMRFGVGHITPRSRIVFGPEVEFIYKDSIRDRRRLGFGVTAARVLSPQGELGGSITAWRQDYPSASFRDGTAVSAILSYRHILSPTVTLSVAISAEAEETERSHLDHRDLGLVTGIEREWTSGLITNFSLGYERSSYRGDFPGTNLVRLDHINTIGIAMRHRKFLVGGYAPEISYAFTQSRSNVGIFEFDSHDFGFSLSKRF